METSAVCTHYCDIIGLCKKSFVLSILTSWRLSNLIPHLARSQTKEHQDYQQDDRRKNVNSDSKRPNERRGKCDFIYKLGLHVLSYSVLHGSQHHCQCEIGGSTLKAACFVLFCNKLLDKILLQFISFVCIVLSTFMYIRPTS